MLVKQKNAQAMHQCRNYNALMDTLFAPAPDFDKPIAVLKHCHDRIRKQLNTLQGLVNHLRISGADLEAQQAAQAVMKYFNHAGVNHHEDEECDLLPLLQATAQGEDARLLSERIPQLLLEHRAMEAVWKRLNEQLATIAAGTSSSLSHADVKEFTDAYTAHMAMEESDIAPMALRLFSDAQMKQLGAAMRARRNITQQPE